MNINPDKIKQLMELFVSLNDEYQNKAIALLLDLQIEQSVENNYDKEEGKKSDNKNQYLRKEAIKERKKKRINDVCNVLELMNKMDSTQLASMALVMEKLKPGAFTKEDDITITINSKQVSIEEYLKKILPDADLDGAKALADDNLMLNKSE